MNVDASPGLLCDVPDGGAALADDCSDHVAGDETAEREVAPRAGHEWRLTRRPAAGRSAVLLAARPTRIPRQAGPSHPLPSLCSILLQI
jgi:hypothetical protein